MTDPGQVRVSKVDPTTGTAVEFKGPNGAKVEYDSPHPAPGPGHDMSGFGMERAEIMLGAILLMMAHNILIGLQIKEMER